MNKRAENNKRKQKYTISITFGILMFICERVSVHANFLRIGIRKNENGLRISNDECVCEHLWKTFVISLISSLKIPIFICVWSVQSHKSFVFMLNVLYSMLAFVSIKCLCVLRLKLLLHYDILKSKLFGNAVWFITQKVKVYLEFNEKKRINKLNSSKWYCKRVGDRRYETKYNPSIYRLS